MNYTVYKSCLNKITPKVYIISIYFENVSHSTVCFVLSTVHLNTYSFIPI